MYMTIHEPTGEFYTVHGSQWYAGMPQVMTPDGPRRLGYWESRFEMAEWACAKLGLEPHECEFVWCATGEVMTFADFEAEYLANCISD